MELRSNLKTRLPLQRWGLGSVKSLAARTLYQVERFNQAVEESHGQLVPIRYREDLEHYLSIRTRNNLTAAFLGIEGLHALDGQLENVNRFYEAGIRMMSASHFFDNDVGGSAHGLQKYGLTALGKQVIERAESLSTFPSFPEGRARDSLASLCSRYPC